MHNKDRGMNQSKNIEKQHCATETLGSIITDASLTILDNKRLFPSERFPIAARLRPIFSVRLKRSCNRIFRGARINFPFNRLDRGRYSSPSASDASIIQNVPTPSTRTSRIDSHIDSRHELMDISRQVVFAI